MSGFERLIVSLQKLADDAVAEIETKASANVQAVLEQEYESGRDPNGSAWKAKADGTASNLQKTGAMRSGTTAVRGIGGVKVSIPKPGGFHQSGTKRMPARPLVPASDDLPPNWDKAVRSAVDEVFDKALKK